jgi:hypothetical protein
MAAHRMDKESARRGLSPPGSVTRHRACDIKASALHLIKNFGSEAPEHIHTDVLDSLHPLIRQRLCAMEPEAAWPVERKQAAYKAICRVMQGAYEKGDLFNDAASAECIKHGKVCSGFNVGASGITMSIHGTACTAWSSCG